jgi:hypothetical protein
MNPNSRATNASAKSTSTRPFAPALRAPNREISNRGTKTLEIAVTPRKQSTAPSSNRGKGGYAKNPRSARCVGAGVHHPPGVALGFRRWVPHAPPLRVGPLSLPDVAIRTTRLQHGDPDFSAVGQGPHRPPKVGFVFLPCQGTVSTVPKSRTKAPASAAGVRADDSARQRTRFVVFSRGARRRSHLLDSTLRAC